VPTLTIHLYKLFVCGAVGINAVPKKLRLLVAYTPMFQTHLIAGRVVIEKTVGFILGGITFVGLPVLGSETSTLFNLGVWLLSTDLPAGDRYGQGRDLPVR